MSDTVFTLKLFFLFFLKNVPSTHYMLPMNEGYPGIEPPPSWPQIWLLKISRQSSDKQQLLSRTKIAGKKKEENRERSSGEEGGWSNISCFKVRDTFPRVGLPITTRGDANYNSLACTPLVQHDPIESFIIFQAQISAIGEFSVVKKCLPLFVTKALGNVM